MNFKFILLCLILSNGQVIGMQLRNAILIQLQQNYKQFCLLRRPLSPYLINQLRYKFTHQSYSTCNNSKEIKIAADMITTGYELPGYSVVKSLGIIASCANTAEDTAFNCDKEKMQCALNSLTKTAQELGANSIIGIKYFSTNEMGYNTNIIVYGNAVIAEKNQK